MRKRPVSRNTKNDAARLPIASGTPKTTSIDLADVLDEVEKQIKHLDRQAKTAERYGRLKDEERKTGAELLALRLRDLDIRAKNSSAILGDKETALEALIADQRKDRGRN